MGYNSFEEMPVWQFEGSSNLVEEIWKELNSLINSLEKKT